MSLDLNHKIFGFFKEPELEVMKKELMDLGVSEDHILIVPASQASDIVDPGGKHSSLFDKAKTYMQRVIGGGPSEFMRDVQRDYDQFTYMVGVQVEGDEEKDRVGKILKSHDGHYIKFFHPMYVEHLTVERDHDQIENVPVR